LLADDAFESHYREIQPGLLRFVTSRIRDPQAARDLVQEVFARAFRHRDRFDASRPFSTWVYSIARNACIDYLRRRVRDPLAVISPSAPGEAPELDTLPDRDTSDPAESAERKDLLRAVRAVLQDLPDHRRAALEMKVVDGLTYREIAEALEAPLGTVAFWVREAIETVQRRLGERA